MHTPECRQHTPITKCRFHPARGESEVLFVLYKQLFWNFPLVPLTITAALNSYKVSRDSRVWNVLLSRLSSVLGSLDNDYPTWHICPQKETEPGWDRKRQITEIRYTEADGSDFIWVPLVLSWRLWFVRRGAIGKKWRKTRWQAVNFLS